MTELQDAPCSDRMFILFSYRTWKELDEIHIVQSRFPQACAYVRLRSHRHGYQR